MYRLMAVGIVLLWAGAMAALFMRDVYPAWTAQDAPPITQEQIARIVDRTEQLGIFDEDGKRRGTAWSNVSTSGGNIAIAGTVHFVGLGLVPAILVETLTDFDPQGELDSFQLQVHGLPMTLIRVHGERHGIYFPVHLQVGAMFRQANLDMSATRLMGDAFRPFSYLPTLKVGQSWRMQVVDPISAVMGSSAKFTPIIARVTGREIITHEGKQLECFVVETSPNQTKAWVGMDGRVYVQQVTMPGFGKLTIRAEAFNEQARAKVRQSLMHNRGDRPNKLMPNPVDIIGKTISGALGRSDDE